MTYKCYFELRRSLSRSTDSLAADLARHLHTRQYLGKVVIVCDNPHSTLSALRKQWLKLTRYMQKQRASTLNADKILKYTHTITHMQHLEFTNKPPISKPDADVYIMDSGDLSTIPPSSWSIYVTAKLTQSNAKRLVSQLPGESLITDYAGGANWDKLGCKPKSELDQNVKDQWRQAIAFLKNYKINIESIENRGQQNVDAIDSALDILLGTSHKFLSVAGEFQRALELARPLHIPKDLRASYDSFILLAHRVQALSQISFTQRFLQTYNEDDDTFLLHDGQRVGLTSLAGYTSVENISRQLAAGRHRLADALTLAQKLDRPRPHAVGLTL